VDADDFKITEGALCSHLTERYNHLSSSLMNAHNYSVSGKVGGLFSMASVRTDVKALNSFYANLKTAFGRKGGSRPPPTPNTENTSRRPRSSAHSASINGVEERIQEEAK
jgi:hypothetical protein